MAQKEFPRRGAWAKLADGTVGIIASIHGKEAEFHATDDKGETISVNGMWIEDKEHGRVLKGGIPLEFLEQAQFNDIPKPRRPIKELKDVAVRMGYK